MCFYFLFNCYIFCILYLYLYLNLLLVAINPISLTLSVADVVHCANIVSLSLYLHLSLLLLLFALDVRVCCFSSLHPQEKQIGQLHQIWVFKSIKAHPYLNLVVVLSIFLLLLSSLLVCAIQIPLWFSWPFLALLVLLVCSLLRIKSIQFLKNHAYLLLQTQSDLSTNDAKYTDILLLLLFMQSGNKWCVLINLLCPVVFALSCLPATTTRILTTREKEEANPFITAHKLNW